MHGENKEECYNFIKVLLKRNDETLFVCGTNAVTPFCRNYKISTLEPEEKVITGQGRCPYHKQDSNIALFADGNLYSATVSDYMGRDAVIYRSIGDSPKLRTFKDDSRWLKNPHFVHAVDYGNYIYFFFHEEAVEYSGLEKLFLPRVARVCKNDMGGNAEFLENEWTSFLKARLACSIPGDIPFHFNTLQAVTDVVKYHGQDVVIAVFTTPSSRIPASAVCAFSLPDIEKVFDGSFKEQKTPHSRWTPVPDSKVPVPRPGSCAGSGSLEGYASSHDIPRDTLHFLRKHTLMDKTVESFSHEPWHLRTNAKYWHVKIAVDNAAGPNGDHTVVFLGATDGWVTKFLARPEGNIFIESMKVYSYEKCSSGQQRDAIVVDMKVDKPNEVLYVAFSHCIVRVPLGSCERHGPCKE
ncbi:semaphorin-6A-like [Varanus komodoensis]|uniref:semaphorin-6A-like n=1 Tax=Varanus komodoensis TaxID=61221 RepID=UPI001CF7A611|nr:semaphorin-6A-like [Varanus komodoensis]